MRKQDLLVYLATYKNQPKNAAAVPLIEKLMNSINGLPVTIPFTEEEKNQLITPSLSSKIFYILKNLSSYQKIIPQEVKTILDNPRKKYIELTTALDQKYAILEGEIKTGNFSSKEAKLEAQQKLRIFGYFSKSIMAYDDTAKFSLDDVYTIRNLIPKRLFEYKNLLPTTLLPPDVKIIDTTLIELLVCKNKIEQLDFEKIGFAPAVNAANEAASEPEPRKKYLLSRFPKDIDTATPDQIKTTIANLFVQYKYIKNSQNELSRVLETSLIDLLKISPQEVDDARSIPSKKQWFSKHRGKSAAEDPVFALIETKVNADRSIKRDVHNVMVVAGMLTDTNAMTLFSAPKKEKVIDAKTTVATAEYFNSLQLQLDLTAKAVEEESKMLLNMMNLRIAMKKYPDFGLTHTRQERAAYLGDLMMETISKYDAVPLEEKPNIVNKLAVELYIHYISLLFSSKRSTIAKELGLFLADFLGIDKTAENISDQITLQMCSKVNDSSALQKQIDEMDKYTKTENIITVGKVTAAEFEKFGKTIETNVPLELKNMANAKDFGETISTKVPLELENVDNPRRFTAGG